MFLGKTGIFFEEQTIEAVKKAILEVENIKFDKKEIREHAMKFDEKEFQKKIIDFISSVRNIGGKLR